MNANDIFTVSDERLIRIHATLVDMCMNDDLTLNELKRLQRLREYASQEILRRRVAAELQSYVVANHKLFNG